MSTTTLRPLEWTDLAALARHEQELFADDAWTEATWWSELAGRPRRDYRVATDESGAILGYAGLDLAGETADVMTLATTTAGRGRGLGRVLLDDLVARATESGAQALVLEVRDDNVAARRLYDTAGFEVIARRRRYYRGTAGAPDVDALVMRRHLGTAAQGGTGPGGIRATEKTHHEPTAPSRKDTHG